MPRYDLTISPNYVSDWSVSDAIRELVQNALDQESLNPENRMNISFAKESDGTFSLSISNLKSSLDKSSLVLGNTTKEGDTSQIGQFGEGYKLACLVFLRKGLRLQILNYGKREIWTPKFVRSSKFNSMILAIEITAYWLKRVPTADLTWIIRGLSEADVLDWRDKNLVTNKNYRSFPLGPVEVLTEEKHKGCIYVRGLFVGKLNQKKVAYGYNLPPDLIKLDRDRKTVESFNAFWQLSSVWGKYGTYTQIADLIKAQAPEAEYLEYSITSGHKEFLLRDFKVRYGEDAIPVTNQDQYDDLRARGYRGDIIHVSPHYYSLIGSSFVDRVNSFVSKTPYQVLNNFFQSFDTDMSTAAQTAFKDILESSKRWKN